MGNQKNRKFEDLMGDIGNLADDLWGTASGIGKELAKNKRENAGKKTVSSMAKPASPSAKPVPSKTKPVAPADKPAPEKVSENPFGDIEELIEDLQKNIDRDMGLRPDSLSGVNQKNTGNETKEEKEQTAAEPPQPEAPKEPETDPQEDLNALVGLKNLKKDVKDLIALVKTQKMRQDSGLKVVPVSKHLVFTGNPGTGKTTVARILARLYRQIGVLSKGQLVEVDRSGLVAGYVGQTAIQTQKKIQEAMGGILFIDEAYTLAKAGGNDFGQEAIDTVLKAMEDHRDDFVVIVAGYSDLMEDFINSNPGLKSRFNKYFHFPDYSADELIRIFESQCRRYDYQLEEDAREIVVEKITELEAKKDDNFANARDIRNLFETIITRQATRLAACDAPTAEDMSRIVKSDVTGEVEYKLIAVDMDGTVLNKESQMTSRTKEMIHKAIAEGKEVVFCTGRCYAEMEEILEEFPDIHYLCGESGGLIYDLKEKKVLYTQSIPQELIDAIVEDMKETDFVPYMMASGKAYSNNALKEDMVRYQMTQHEKLLGKVCIFVDDLIAKQKQEGFTVEKFNLFHTSPEERAKTLERLKNRNLPVELVYSEISSLEVTPKGVDKAFGLKHLSDITGITLAEMIMVGDADNDLSAINACGLGVAMGNANDNVKNAAQVMVADNDHDGVAEAIEQYLLK